MKTSIKIATLLLISLAFLFFAQNVNSQEITLQPIKDGYMKSNPASGNGSSSYLSAGFNTTSSYEMRSVLQFDISSISSDETVTSAILSLYHGSYTTPSNNDISAYRASSSWSENSITWGTPSFSGSSYDGCVGGTWTTWDITDLVQQWVDGTYTNYGVYLKPDASLTDEYLFYSREYSTSAYRPKLEIITETTMPFEVTDPDDNDIWQQGEEDVDIDWETGNYGGNVSIHLFQNGNSIYTIKSSTSNDGSYDNWDVPVDCEAATNYYVRIQTLAPAQYDVAVSETFEIEEAGGIITVTEPTTSTIWTLGQQNVSITWETGDITGDVAIELFKQTFTTPVEIISSSTSNDGTYTWSVVPTTLVPGINYKVKVISLSNSSKHDLSDYFEVAAIPSYSVSGTAISQLNNFDKIPGATVTIDGNPSFSGVTAGDGTYQINDIPSGQHTISISHPGYNWPTSSYTINVNGSIVQDFYGQCLATPQISYVIPSEFTAGTPFNIEVTVTNINTAVLNIPCYLDVSFPDFTSSGYNVQLISQSGFDGDPSFHAPESPISRVNQSTGIWNWSYPADYLLVSGTRTATIYNNQDWTYTLQITPPDISTMTIYMKASIGDKRDPDNGAIGQQGLWETTETINNINNAYDITMQLYRVSDTDGIVDTDNPGTEKTSFAPGETVRITFKSKNDGTQVPIQTVLNVISPDGGDAYDSNPDNNNLNPLTADGSWHYFSFDWTIQDDYDDFGNCDIGGSTRNLNDFDILYETTCVGANTNFSCDWVLEDEFEVIDNSNPNTATTVLESLTEIANQRSIQNNYSGLYELYHDYNKKQYAYFSGSPVPGVGLSIYIDLADYYSSMSKYSSNYITTEGHNGWITVYIDGSVGLDYAITPGFGVSALSTMNPPGLDPRREIWEIDALSSSMPFIQTNILEWTWDDDNGYSFDWGNASYFPTIEISATIVKLSTNATRFEIQKSNLDNIIDLMITANQLSNGFISINNYSDYINKVENTCNQISTFQDIWKVFANNFTQFRQFTVTEDNIRPQYSGVLNHIRGGADINFDGIPDNYYPVLEQTQDGTIYNWSTEQVTFINTGNEYTDFIVKVVDVPDGWLVGAIDNDIWDIISDHSITKENISPSGLYDDEIVTDWAFGAGVNAPEQAIVTFNLYRRRPLLLGGNVLLTSVIDTLHKTIPNEEPFLSILTPLNNITKTEGQPINVFWDDEDPDDNAYISFAIDPDINETPWLGDNNHQWIQISISEDPDGSSDEICWTVSNLYPGTYSIWGLISDSHNNPVYDRAIGLVTIEGNLETYIIFNETEDIWLKENGVFDIDFLDESGIGNIKYQISSNDDTNPSNWHNLTIDGVIDITQFSGNEFTDDWMISNTDWDNLPLNSQTQGWHYIYFKVEDDAGNIFITPTQEDAFKFGKDENAPSCYFTPPPENNQVINETDVTVTWYVDDMLVGLPMSGVEYIYYKIDNEPDYTQVGPDVSSHTFTNLSEGPHTVYLYATDNAGNQHDVEELNFTINTSINPPNTFALSSPDNEVTLTDLTPSFQWQSTTDPDGGTITYELWYDYNPSFSNRTEETTSNNYFTPSSNLDDNSTVFWKVKAIDDEGDVIWCNEIDWSFNLNTQNNPPSAFNLNEPQDEAVVSELTPYFDWTNSIDNDPGDEVTYLLLLSLQQDFSSYEEYTSSVSEYSLNTYLAPNTTYYWKVEAVDNDGATTWASETDWWFTTPPANIYTISGTILDSDNTAVEGVTIIFSDGGGSTTTNSSGYYTITVNEGYSGTATPTKTNWIFSPVSLSYNNVSSNFYNMDYVAAINANTLNENLIHYYPLDGDLQDVVGTNHFTNHSSVDDIGKINNGRKFNESTTGQYAAAGSISLTDAASMSFWFYSFGTQPIHAGVLFKAYGSPHGDQSIFGAQAATGQTLHISVQGSSAGVSVQEEFTHNEWHHVVLVFDGQNQMMKTFFDGVLTETSTTFSSLYNPTSKIKMGMQKLSYRSFKGKLDEIGYWDCVLTDADAYALYNGGAGLAYPFTNSYTISGSILESDNTPIEGVDVTFSNSGGATTTNSSGYYTITVDEGYSGTATSTKAGWVFAPASKSYTNISSDILNEDYVGEVSTSSISQNLLHYYKLDGDLVDCIGTVDGTNSNTLDESNGLINHAREFTGATNCYIETSNSSSFNYLHNGSDFTISIWEKHNTGVDESYVMMGNSIGVDRRGLFFSVYGDNVSFSVGRLPPYPVTSNSWEDVLSPNTTQWNHLVVTYDNLLGSGQYTLYVNGQLTGTGDRTNPCTTGNSYFPMRFGINKLSGTRQPFNGDLDEIAFWDRKLDASEVVTLYNNGNGLQHPFSLNIPSNVSVQNKTFNNGQNECYNATSTITIAGSGTTVDLNSGSEATFIAGQNIFFKPGFHAYNGSYGHAYITTTGEYCNQQQTMLAVQDPPETVITTTEESSIEETAKGINIYPNPTTGNFTIDFMGEATTADIMLLNLQGNKFIETKCRDQIKQEIDIGHLPMGMYIIVIKTEEKIITKKIIKNY